MVKEARKFDIGEKIMAKWPNTSLYFNGEVIDYNDIQYLVKFDDPDKSEFPLKFSEVGAPFLRRSRSRSRGRTPTRKSPARKQSKSPGRPAGSKSPARPAAPKSPGRSPRSRKELGETEIKQTKSNSTDLRLRQSGTRQSARIANASEKKSSLDGKPAPLKVDREAVVRKVSLMQTWKGRLIRLLYALWATIRPLPSVAVFVATPFVITQMCTKNTCSLAIPDIPRRLKYYYDPKAVMIVGGFFLFQLLLTFIPLGKVLKLKNGINYHCNGYIALLATIVLPLVMMRLEYDFTSWYLLYRQMLTTCVALCFVVGVLLYAKSFYSKRSTLNKAGTSGYLVPDLSEGRELTPTIGRLDVKMFLMRFWMMLVILLEFMILMRNWKTSQGSQYSICLMVMTSMHLFYAVDFIWFEESMVSTYEYARTGMGLLKLLEYTTIPFSFAFFPRFLLNHGKDVPWYCFVGIVSLYIVGYVVVRGANSQKHAFRSNPSDPALVHLESLPTAAGTRILVSGWWGFVRHPNYLGDIIVQLAITLLCGFNYSLPWIMYGLSVLSLLARIFTVERDCKKKYGLAWSSYTSRVKYRLIPKVF